MPYIITTTTYPAGSPMPNGQTRRAVATPDEAREDVEQIAAECQIPDHEWRGLVDCINTLPESGGTVGPLPDGTLIEVRFESYGNLWKEVTGSKDGQPVDTGEIIDAYNAAREAI